MQVARSVMMAHCEVELNGVESARGSLEAAAGQLEAMLERAPGNAQLRQLLGGIHARLGNGDSAIREGRLAVELTAKDRFEGPTAEQELARIYAQLGRADDAMDLVERLLGMSYKDSVTLTDLRLDPAWDGIRENERFRALVGE
jgi:tetratricopeptide (TPR) repeat protein